MVKILAAGDFHGDISLAKRLADKADKENIDLIILNGDLVEEHSPDGVVGQFAKSGKKLLLIHGNHESNATIEFLAKRYGAQTLHGESTEVYDVGIFGCGGANIGIDQLSEDEIFYLLKKGFEKVKHKSKKIMVTHVHPANSIMEKFSQFIPGSTAVRKAIEEFKPDIVICGHVHEAEGIEEKIGVSKVVNVGRKGAVFDFKPETK